MDGIPFHVPVLESVGSSERGLGLSVSSPAPRYNGGSDGKWYRYFKYPVGAHTHTENLTLLKLRDVALFAVAQDLWHRNIDLNTPVMNVEWESQTDRIISLVPEYCGGKSAEMIDAITDCVKIIGEEMSQLANYFKLNCIFGYAVKHMRACDIYWTSSFTIDRFKTAIMLPWDTRDRINIYPEPIPQLFVALHRVLGFQLRPSSIYPYITNYFEEHAGLVFLIWVCYMKTAVSLTPLSKMDTFEDSAAFNQYIVRLNQSFLREHLKDFRTYYEANTAAENIFRYMVVTDQVEFLPYYLAKIDAEKRNQNLYVMAKQVTTEYHPTRFGNSERRTVNTLIFLLSNMDESNKFRFVQENFKHFGNFLMSYPGTEPLVSAMKLYTASEENFKDVRRLLKMVAAVIQPTHKKSQKYWQLFYILYRKVSPWLEVMDVIDLLENILRVKDIKTAVMMFNCSKNKSALISEIHSIWNDLWKASVEKEVFLTFFFEVQSDMIEPKNKNSDA